MSKEQRKEIQPLSGFRDLLAEQMIPRQEMIDTIRNVYESYGFTPLDTPTIERLDTLRGKYGEEGEKLMYKLTDQGGTLLALRYDLTVPLARVIAQHGNELPMPYKRYQVGNVFRGESPQAGRYREFMQFDADTVGASGPLVDTEVIAMMADTMDALGVNALVRVNNRLILDALVNRAGLNSENDARALIRTIDKAEKIGTDQAVMEIGLSFGGDISSLVHDYLTISGTTQERLQQVETLLGRDTIAGEGVENLINVFSILEKSGYTTDRVVYDQTIARGLDYYTGIIYETTLKDLPKIGSVCSGGRYDSLIEKLGGPNLPAVGTSVGVDRLFEGLRQLGKFEQVKTKSQVLVINFDEEHAPNYMSIATSLRKAGIATEVFFNPDKVGKQLKYANRIGVKYAVFMGSNEIEKGMVTLKDLRTGEQKEVSLDHLLDEINVN